MSQSQTHQNEFFGVLHYPEQLGNRLVIESRIRAGSDVETDPSELKGVEQLSGFDQAKQVPRSQYFAVDRPEIAVMTTIALSS